MPPLPFASITQMPDRPIPVFPPTARVPFTLLLCVAASACSWLGLSGGGAGELAVPAAPEEQGQEHASTPEISYDTEGFSLTPEDSALLASLRDEPLDEELPPEPEPGDTWADRTFAELTLREKVGQLIMPWVLGDFAPEGSPSHDRIATTWRNRAWAA
jgi:hypothetical protein